MGRATAFLGPALWGPGEGSTGQILFNLNNKANIKDFLYQTLYVFSQIKYIKRIEWDFFVLSLGHAP